MYTNQINKCLLVLNAFYYFLVLKFLGTLSRSQLGAVVTMAGSLPTKSNNFMVF